MIPVGQSLLALWRGSDIAALVLFVILLAAFGYFLRRGPGASADALRPIAAYDALRSLVARAAETGQRVHISVGVAGVGGASTADTTAGLNVLEYLAGRAAVSGAPPLVTVSDPTAVPIAQDHLRRAYRQQGYAEEYDARQARWIAPPISGSAVPYAAGVMDILEHEDLVANVMVGSFGDEFLLMSETGARRDLLQVAGAGDPFVLPFVYSTASHALLGEEIYAAGAYLGGRAAQLAGLLAQDTVRFVLIALVIVMVLARSLGLL